MPSGRRVGLAQVQRQLAQVRALERQDVEGVELDLDRIQPIQARHPPGCVKGAS
jgi:hypothetical protein